MEPEPNELPESSGNVVQSPRHPPQTVLFIAAVFIIGGVSSLVGMIADWVSGRVSINFGVFGVLIGRGLLAGDMGTRMVAVFLTWAAFFVGGALALTALIKGSWKLEPAEYPWIGVGSLVAVVGLVIICLIGLRSRSAQEWFELPNGARVTHSAWWWPLCFVGLAFSAAAVSADFVSNRSFEKLSRDAFPVNTEFTFADARTGLPVPSIGTSGHGLISARHPAFAPRFSHGYSSRDGFMLVHLEGMAWKPEDVTFTCPGYEDFVYTLNRSSEQEVRVEMIPLKPSEDGPNK